jgi:carbon-monoxide dehydrogenase medium subunit
MSRLFRPKEYFRPTTIKQALLLLEKYKDQAKPIAGGTDLLVEKPAQVKYLIDITYLPLRFIKQDEKKVRIGALTTMRELETSELLKTGPFSILAEAAHRVGSLQTRNVATVGGNICNALPSADTPPALVALDAQVKVVGPVEEKVFPIEDLFVGVRKTILKNDQLLTEIQVPKPPANSGAAFFKIGRTKMDIATVNVAVLVHVINRVFKKTRVIIGGGVGTTMVRSKKAEALLNGKKISDSLIDMAAQVASKELSPRSTSIRGSPFYKKEISKVLVKRAIKKALLRCGA